MRDDQDIPESRRAIERVTSRFNVYFLFAMALLSGVLMLAGIVIVASQGVEPFANVPESVLFISIGAVGFCLFFPWFTGVYFARHLLVCVKKLEREVEILRVGNVYKTMTSDEQQIRQLVATWIAATKAGDTETVLSLMADDVVFLITGQPPMIGKAAFAAGMQSQPGQGRPQFDGKSEIQEVQVLGDWAFMWTKLTVVVTPPDGQPMTRAGHTLSILKKQNGKWLLSRDANMLSSTQIK